MMESIDIVIPFYESAHTIDELLSRMQDTIDSNSLNATLILIDDGSTDNSWERMTHWLQNSKLNITAIKLYRNYGQHPATVAGLQNSTSELIVIMDCDLQDRPEDIPNLINRIRETASDLVVTRSVNNRNIISRFPSYVFHLWTKSPKNVTTFRVARRSLVDSLLRYPEASKLSGPLMIEISAKTVYMEIDRQPRLNGSRYSLLSRFNIAISYFLSRTSSVATVFFVTGIIVSIFSLAYMSFIFFQSIQHRVGISNM